MAYYNLTYYHNKLHTKLSHIFYNTMYHINVFVTDLTI